MDAMQRGDVDAVVSLLAEDASWSMPPLAAWFSGREALRGFMRFGPLSGDWRWRQLPTRANGQPAVGSYAWYEPDGCYRPFALDVITLDGDRIGQITSFITAPRSAASSSPTCASRSSPWTPPSWRPFERFGCPTALD